MLCCFLGGVFVLGGGGQGHQGLAGGGNHLGGVERCYVGGVSLGGNPPTPLLSFVVVDLFFLLFLLHFSKDKKTHGSAKTLYFASNYLSPMLATSMTMGLVTHRDRDGVLVFAFFLGLRKVRVIFTPLFFFVCVALWCAR